MRREKDTVPVNARLIIALGLILGEETIKGTDAKSQPAISRAGKILRHAFKTRKMTENERLAVQRAVNSIDADQSD